MTLRVPTRDKLSLVHTLRDTTGLPGSLRLKKSVFSVTDVICVITWVCPRTCHVPHVYCLPTQKLCDVRRLVQNVIQDLLRVSLRVIQKKTLFSCSLYLSTPGHLSVLSE
jgi:hypothetical protein